MEITHTTVAPGTDSGDGKISKNAWDEAHTFATTEMDTAKVLAPDGAGGVEWKAVMIATKDEGTTLSSSVTTLDFVGDGVTATVSGAMTTITIPGGGGLLIDIPPESPSAYDEEFDAALSGSWTTLGSLDTSDANVVPGMLHLAKTATGVFQLHGIYKACPTPPFTVTAKLTAFLNSANYQNHALLLASASPGALMLYGPVYQSSNGTPETIASNWSNRTTRVSLTEYAGTKPTLRYIRLIVNSSTSVDCEWSDGWFWVRNATAWNPGFTVANVGFVMTGNDNSTACEVYVDWVRFT